MLLRHTCRKSSPVLKMTPYVAELAAAPTPLKANTTSGHS